MGRNVNIKRQLYCILRTVNQKKDWQAMSQTIKPNDNAQYPCKFQRKLSAYIST